MKKHILSIALTLLSPLFIFANDCNYIMDDNRMEIIIEQMNNKNQDIKKLNIIKTYLQRLCINTNQMLTIIEVFESEEVRKEFFLYSKEYITDMDNYKKLQLNQ